jgi:hypothetical protein
MMEDKTENQESLMPMRKVLSALVSAILFAVTMTLVTKFFPNFSLFLDTEAVSAMITFLVFAVPGLVSAAAAYFTKEWKK